ncbi:hypothetical protein [Nitrosomonas oligotropha]|uniref:hypothetical protein n=1 Tax=Nitrosomonas oligotropha TaxID=42354 RepID=UPI001368CD6D|nr:hypothetical protein [Nitrosomonas oligotropha]
MRRTPGISSVIVAHLSVIPAQAGIEWVCFNPEIECFKALQQVNPNVRDEEIQQSAARCRKGDCGDLRTNALLAT